MTVAVTQDIQWNIHDAVLTTLTVASRWRDRRFPTLNFPVTQVRQQSIAGTPIVSPLVFPGLANTLFQFAPPKGIAVLIPGTGIAFDATTNASRFTANFFWRERALEQSELDL